MSLPFITRITAGLARMAGYTGTQKVPGVDAIFSALSRFPFFNINTNQPRSKKTTSAAGLTRTPALAGRSAPLALTQAPEFPGTAHAMALGRILTNTRESHFSRPAGLGVQVFVSDWVFAIRGILIENDLLNKAMGFFTGLGMISSIDHLRRQAGLIKQGIAVQDYWQVASSGLFSATEAMGLTYSGAYLADRLASVSVHGHTGLTAPTSAGRFSAHAGMVADAGFAVYGVFLSLYSFVQFAEIGSFGVAFEQRGGDEVERLRFLQNTLVFDVKKYMRESEPSCEQLEDLAVEVLRKETKAQNKEVTGIASKEEAKEHFNKILTDATGHKWYRSQLLLMMHLTEEDVQGFSTLALCGLAEEMRRRTAKKYNKIDRLLGEKVMKTIKKIESTGLIERLQAGCKYKEIGEMAKKEVKALTSSVRKELLKNVANQLVLLSLGALCVALGVMSVLMTLGVATFPPSLMLALSIVFVACIFAADFGGLKRALTTSNPTKWDYLLLGVSTFVVIASFATSLGLILAMKLALTQLIKPAIILVGGLVMNVVALYRFSKRKEQWMKEHPTLQAVADVLTGVTGQVSKETAELFKKLPKEDRLAVKGRLRNASHYNRDAAFLTDKRLEDVDHRARCMRGVKKAAKRAWENYHRQTTDSSYRKALEIQRLLDLFKEEKTEEAIKHLGQLSSSAYSMVVENVRTIVKREESAEALREAIVDAAKRPDSILVQGSRA